MRVLSLVCFFGLIGLLCAYYLIFADLAGLGDLVHQNGGQEYAAQGYQLLLSRVHGRLPLLDQGSATSITPPPRQTSPSV